MSLGPRFTRLCTCREWWSHVVRLRLALSRPLWWPVYGLLSVQSFRREADGELGWLSRITLGSRCMERAHHVYYIWGLRERKCCGNLLMSCKGRWGICCVEYNDIKRPVRGASIMPKVVVLAWLLSHSSSGPTFSTLLTSGATSTVPLYLGGIFACLATRTRRAASLLWSSLLVPCSWPWVFLKSTWWQEFTPAWNGRRLSFVSEGKCCSRTSQ